MPHWNDNNMRWQEETETEQSAEQTTTAPSSTEDLCYVKSSKVTENSCKKQTEVVEESKASSKPELDQSITTATECKQVQLEEPIRTEVVVPCKSEVPDLANMEVINLGKSHERDGHTEPVKQEFIEKERKAEPAIERELDSAESDEAKESSIKDTPKCALIINLVAEVKDETRSCEGESQSELTENKRKRCEEEERYLRKWVKHNGPVFCHVTEDDKEYKKIKALLQAKIERLFFVVSSDSDSSNDDSTQPTDEEGMSGIEELELESKLLTVEREYREWKKSIMLVYGRMANHKYASLFLRPITDEQPPSNSSLVVRRIDLLRIKQNIHTGVTRTTIELQRDVMLMFFNSLWYNECSFYDHRMGPELLDCYLQNYQDWLNTQELVQSVGEAPHYRETMTSEGNTHKDVLSTPGSGSQDEGYKTSGGKRKRVSESKKGSNKKRQEEAKELLDEGEPVKQEFIEKEQKAELAIKRELDSAESDEVKETSIEDTPKCALIKNLVAEVKDERSCEGESKSELTKRKRKRREHEQWAIDLLRIEKNIKTGVTRTWTEIQRDLMLAFFNHMKYKCSLLVHRIASEMVEDCLQLIQIFMEMAERL